MAFFFLLAMQTKPQVWQKKCVGCEDCVNYCPVSAIRIKANGKAVIDQEKCIDCKMCITSCSYGAIR